MSETANLALPVLEAAQAQKHVTHNDALRLLDGLVQLAVTSRDVNAPPGSPVNGARYLVGPTPTGAFAAHAGEVALWEDGAWRFMIPKSGWRIFVADEPALIVRDGATWKQIGAFVTALSNLTELGVGTAPDPTNRIAAKLNAALFVAKTVAEGGTGDLRINFSKETAGNTLSHLFQVNYSGRAEIGLAGDEKMRLRVSADGSTWRDAMIADPIADSVSLLTGGATRLCIATSGNVGVGQSTPAHKLTVGAQNGQSTAAIAARASVNSFEWGHTNTAGYASTIGHNFLSGAPFIAFCAEAGTTSNTYRTRGLVGRIIECDSTGVLKFARAANSNADNQTPTYDVAINASGNLGIGTTGPTTLIEARRDQNAATSILASNPNAGSSANATVQANANATQTRITSLSTAGGGAGQLSTTSALLQIEAINASGVIALRTGSTPSDRILVDSSGRVGVGAAPEKSLHVSGTGTATIFGQFDTNLRLQTNTATSGAGCEISFRGSSAAAADVGTFAAISAPISANGATGATGSLSFSVKATQTATSLTEAVRIDGSGNTLIGGVLRPMADNVSALGAAAQRWSVVYAATGTINTSDAEEKSPCDLDRRILLAALDTPLVAFRWNDAIDRKGVDQARIHFGPTAQGFRDACLARGVDPRRLAVYCEDDVGAGEESSAPTIQYGLRLDQFDRLLSYARWLVSRGELEWSPAA